MPKVYITTGSTIQTLTLKKDAHKRIRSGHLWAFRDEVQDHHAIEQGEAVLVQTDYGYDLGVAFYHPTSQIALRFLRTSKEPDASFFEERIRQALELRERHFKNEPVYRLIFGESDFLPGLVVDRYGDYLAAQFLSAGIDRRKQPIVEALLKVLPETKGIIAKNDSALRVKEGLERSTEVLWGDIPDEIEVTENAILLGVSLAGGQKTGYFLDQRRNRSYLAEIAQGLTVLDCFCNQGGFALNAAKGGARLAHGIDISKSAIETCRQNAERNSFRNCTFEVADVFDYLKQQAASNQKWDCVVLDPPAFTKSKAALAQAKRGYADINRQALKLVEQGGFLATSSCSWHMSEADFLAVVADEARRINRRLRLIYRGLQSPCHPIYLPMPETQYLKFFVFWVD